MNNIIYHKFTECQSCNKVGCPYCGPNANYNYCLICGCKFNFLTTHCFGKLIDEYKLDRINKRELNYIFGEWIGLK